MQIFFNYSFLTENSCLPTNLLNQTALQSQTSQRFYSSYASVLDVLSHLKQLKRKKAASHDTLIPGMLKDEAVVIPPPLSHFINLSPTTGKFSMDWKSAKVQPLHRNGVSNQFGNYRPISVLLVLSKITEKV